MSRNGDKKDEMARWMLEKIPDLTIFMTLTYAEEVHPEKAVSSLNGLIGMLNGAELGKNYKNRVKHSYFSYFAVMEYQRRDVAHWHMLTNSWIDFRLVHAWWPKECGWAWIEKVNSPRNFKSGGTAFGAARYLSKYVLKDPEDIVIWVAEKSYERNDAGVLELHRTDGESVKVAER